MTNEEAIRFGKCILMVADDTADSTAIEFTKLALKALEQGDVLREIRQEIEKSVDSYYAGQFREGLCKALNIIDKKIKELSE